MISYHDLALDAIREPIFPIDVKKRFVIWNKACRYILSNYRVYLHILSFKFDKKHKKHKNHKKKVINKQKF